MTAPEIVRLAGALARTFAGPPGRYLLEREDGRGAWSAETWTEAAIHDHVSGTRRIGLPFNPDRLAFAAFDLDGKKHPEGRAWSLATAKLIVRALADLGIRALLEQSRSGVGFHVWILFGVNGPTLTAARAFAAATLRALDLPADFSERAGVPGFYPWPKRSEGCGRVPYLPLFGIGNGHASGLFCDPETGEPFSDQFAALDAAERTPADVWTTAVEAIAKLAPEAPRPSSVARTAPVTFMGEPSAFARAALDREAARVASAAEGSRHSTVYSAARNLGELVGGGELARAIVEANLAAAAASAGLVDGRGHEVEATIRDGIEKGLTNPRHGVRQGDPPRKPETKPTATPGDVPVEPDYLRDGPEAERPPGRVRAWIASDLRAMLTEEPQPVQFLVESLLAKDDGCVLTAAPKDGKTFLAGSLAVECATGRAVFGRYAVPGPLRVLWADEEMGRGKLQRRLQRLARGLALDADALEMLCTNLRLFAQQGFTLTTEQGVEAFLHEVETFRPAIVILDSFAAFTSGIDDGNPERRRFYGSAIAPLRQMGAACLLLAHPPLPSKDAHGDARKRPRGGGDILGTCDRALYLEKVGEEANEHGHVTTTTLGELFSREGSGLDGLDTVMIEDVGELATVVRSTGGALGGLAATLGKENLAARDLLHVLRREDGGEMYQADAKRALKALGHGHTTIDNALRAVRDQRLVEVLPPREGRSGKWLRAVEVEE